jgi:hypothetical protein
VLAASSASCPGRATCWPGAGQGYRRRADFLYRLVEAVAILSFRKKGVEILGLRFKSNENSGRPTPCSPR